MAAPHMYGRLHLADAHQNFPASLQENYFQVPGVIGIRNHGNTCFINSILQCLSYTDILAEYFVLDQYKSDLRFGISGGFILID